MLTREAARKLYQRLLVAMSMGDAKEILGFPPHASPSPKEISRAYKALSFENHPDRGGDHRKMVEINVAVEVLQGKRREGPSRSRVDPEAERRREAEIKRQRHIDQIEDYRDKIQEVMRAYVKGMDRFNVAWRTNLHDWLVEDMARTLDLFLDEADDALKSDLDSKDQRVWKDARRKAQDLMGLGLRTGTKFKTLAEDFREIEDGSMSFYNTESLRKNIRSFVKLFMALDKKSGDLAKVLGTTEAVPVELVDAFWPIRSTLDSFKNDFERIDAHLDNQKSRLAKALPLLVDLTIDILDDYGLSSGLPKWEDWLIPNDFDGVIDRLTRHKTAAARVAERFVRAGLFV